MSIFVTISGVVAAAASLLLSYFSSPSLSSLQQEEQPPGDDKKKHLIPIYTEPDPLLNEGRPCHHIPSGGPATAYEGES